MSIPNILKTIYYTVHGIYILKRKCTEFGSPGFLFKKIRFLFLLKLKINWNKIKQIG